MGDVSATLLHFQFDVSTPRALEFYRRLFARLGLRTVEAGANYLGVTDERVMLVLRGRPTAPPGAVCLSFRVESRSAVDRFVSDFLAAEGITPTAPPHESPRHTAGYYSVRFEGPDATSVDVPWFPL